MIEHGSAGLNSKFNESNSLDSTEDAEEWMTLQFERVMEKLDLPKKIFLAAHCLGCLFISLYALKFPERVVALFCATPFGFTPAPPNYDPRKVKLPYREG